MTRFPKFGEFVGSTVQKPAGLGTLGGAAEEFHKARNVDAGVTPVAAVMSKEAMLSPLSKLPSIVT